MKLKTLFFVVASSLVFSGCTFMNTYTFPMYEVTPENISILSRGAFPQVNVNDFNAEPKNLADEAIKMRTHFIRLTDYPSPNISKKQLLLN